MDVKLTIDSTLADIVVERFDELPNHEMLLYSDDLLVHVDPLISAALIKTINGKFTGMDWKVNVMADPGNRKWETISVPGPDNSLVLISSTVIGPWTRIELDHLSALDEWLAIEAGAGRLKIFDWKRK